MGGHEGAEPATGGRLAAARRRVESSERYRWYVLWSVLGGLLSVNITFTVFVVALPQVAHQLHTTVSTLTWTSTAPLLAFGVAAPVLGKVGDIWGHRRLFVLGLSGAVASVVLTASAPNAGVLIAARALDGIQGAALGSASMAIVLQVFSEEDRVKAMGFWALVGAGGPVVGITLGAPIIQYFGWRALFWGELPLMAIAMTIGLVVLPRRDPYREEEPERGSLRDLDWMGSWTLAGSVTTGLLALDRAPVWGWTATPTLAVFGLSVALGVWFVVHEQRAERPLIPLSYFAKRNFTFPLGARALTNFAYMGGFFLFPVLMESVYGYSETKAGLISTARPLLFSVVAPLAGYAAVVVGERISVAVGASVVVVSMLLFTRFGAHPPMVLVMGALALSGIGIGIVSPSATASASNEIERDELGVMSAAGLLMNQIGVVAGIQVMETVQASGHDTGAIPTSFHRAYFVGAIAAAIAAIFGLFVRNTPRPGRHGALEVETVVGGAEAGALDVAAAETGALEEAAEAQTALGGATASPRPRSPNEAPGATR